MQTNWRKVWTAFLLLTSLFGFLLTLHQQTYNGNPVFGREELLETTNAFKSRRQRSIGDNEDGTKALIYDLEEILELKATIDQIKEEATDPHLDAESKLNKLKELQDALERLQNLRADVIKTEAIEEGTLKTKDTLIDTDFQKETPKTKEKTRPGLNKRSNADEVVHFCNLQLVETVPDVLEEKRISRQLTKQSIFHAWLSLFDGAKSEVNVMSQWAIDGDGRSGDIFSSMKNAVLRRVKLNLLFNNHEDADRSSGYSPHDLKKKAKWHDQVQIGSPQISGLIHPEHIGNIIHSKIIIADNQDLYIGSGNLGSRCTTRTKEMGMVATNCPALALDAKKIWSVYQYISNSTSSRSKLPQIFPAELTTQFDLKNPFRIFNQLDGTTYRVVIGSSPKRLCTEGRSDDLSAILHVIDSAKKFIHISVSEYVPMSLYVNKHQQHEWNVINDHLEYAIHKKNVEVRLLLNEHATHQYEMKKHLKTFMYDVKKRRRSADIEAKIYTSQVDKHRFHGSHSKFMVTDQSGYIGTSNWAEDYFTDTAGTCITFEPEPILNPLVESAQEKLNLVQQLEKIFQRDWRSSLSKYI